MPVRLLQFGPFEFNIRTGDLRKHGARIRLPEQASQILLMLLEHPGEVALRSEIRQKLWPADTVVEFDQSINAAVKRLRNALSESADAPRDIETEAKRGYRFIAEVRQVTPAHEREVDPEPIAPELVPIDPQPSLQEAELRVVASSHRRSWLWLVAVVAAVAFAAVAFAAGLYLQLRGRTPEPLLRVVPLTTLEGQQNFPAFSPDGLEIAFQRDLPAGTSLMIVPAGDLPAGKPRAERKIAAMGFGLSWSPNGDEIAYVAPYPPAGNGGILIRSLRTGAVRQLTAPQPRRDRSVAWSPDGKQVAFSREFGGQVRELFVVAAEGGEARQVTFDKQTMGGFAWTPDSRELVFDSNRKSGTNLWRIGVAGGTPEPVVHTASHPAFPAISLRGNRLVYSDFFVDSNIWRYELPDPASGANALVMPGAVIPNAVKPNAGLQPSKCLICSTVEDYSPRFSPDGRRIAFVARRAGSDEPWTANADGSKPGKLTSLGAHTGSPRWSPDGHWIAFDSTAEGSARVYVIGAAGGTPRRLTTEPSKEIVPSWSYDGQRLYFASDRGAQSHIWKVPFAGGPVRQVTQGDGGEAMESADGKRLYYFRRQREDGLWSVPSRGGLEEPVPELSGLRHTRAWTVRPEGIYFYQVAEGKPQIRFLDFATRNITTVLTRERLTPGLGLDMSPDGRTLLYGQVDHRTDELMMIENFR